MLEQIFAELPELYQPGSFNKPTSIYFSIDEARKTLRLDSSGCRVENGRTLDNADCVCKTTGEFFLNVWNNGYKPGIKDFLSGTIKSNDPGILQKFLQACGKP
jgi:hypothetical protein